MAPFDAFVEKVILHNKLLSKEQLQQAKGAQAQQPGLSLLEYLASAGLLRKEHAAAIQQSYQQQTTKQVIAPAANPAVAEPTAQTQGQALRKMEQLLTFARQQGASDLHLTPDRPPFLRKDGKFIPLDEPPLSAKGVESLIFSILDEPKRQRLLSQHYIDTAYARSVHERYRICFVQQKNGYDASFRLISAQVPSLKSLGLPEEVCRSLMDFHQGLVLVTGPSGCGKTTTVTSMLELINQQRECHIITLEDPVEHLFTPAKSHFSQRQLMDNTESFSAALRAALREDPDVIFIGELRDYETASLAITAAETGHLVISTLHTTSAVRTISRVLDIFPAEQKHQIRMMVSESLRGIICQRLIPAKSGSGRVLAAEVLVNMPAISNLIRKEQLIQIPSVLQTNAAKGMKLMDSAILELFKTGQIDGAEAYFNAESQAPYASFAPKDE